MPTTRSKAHLPPLWPPLWPPQWKRLPWHNRRLSAAASRALSWGQSKKPKPKRERVRAPANHRRKHIFSNDSENSASDVSALCVSGPGVRKRSKAVKEVKKKPKPKKTKSKSGQSGKKKKASSVRLVLLIHPLSFSSTRYFQWHQSDQTVYCADSESWFSLILCSELFSLCVCVCMCAVSRARRTSWRSRTLMTSASTVPLCFLIPRGPPPRKRRDVGGKKGKVCLPSTLAMLCGVFSSPFQNPSEIPQNQTV